MANDPNMRTLTQVLAISKIIIDAKLENEFIAACKARENLFVLATESSRLFMAEFLQKHQLNPNDAQLENFSYGNDRCT